jgi:virginiamycin B lyase
MSIEFSQAWLRSACWIAALLSGVSISLAQQIAINAYSVPSGGSPQGITVGPDGALWFAESSNSIGRITTAGAISEYSVPSSNAGPQGITVGPDGALWFTESFGNRIGRITTAGVITEYPIPTANSSPNGIAAGLDGAVWFAESSGNKIGRITTAGAATEYLVPTANSAPWAITAGPDGALWFTEYNANKIGRITTSGAITEFTLPLDGGALTVQPNAITAGPDGALWFTEFNNPNIVRITTAGAITEYPYPAGNRISPSGITTGPDGAVWFADGNSIGRITASGVFTFYPIPIISAENYLTTSGITAGPDGEIWFTDSANSANAIGEAVFVTAGLSVNPSSASFHTNLTFAGSSFAPNESVQIYVNGVGSAVLASGIADASGSFTATASEPQSPYGPRLFLGVGQSSGKLGATSFSVTPRLILSTKSGRIGSTVYVTAYGFGSLEQLRISWHSPPTVLGNTKANVNGTARFRFKVPFGAFSGPNMVSAVGRTTMATASTTFHVQ